MKDKLDKIKAKKNLNLIIIFMLFLFLYCYVMYTGVGRSKSTYELSGGNDLISQRLQEIIPYSSKNDLSYLTAYQNKKVEINDINNDILLTMAYKFSPSKNSSSFKEILERIYGNSLFLVNKNFNVNDFVECRYNDLTLEYMCIEETNQKELYDVARKIEKLTIKNNIYTLDERVIFYSKEIVNGKETYKVYEDANYQKVVKEFREADLKKQDLNNYLWQNYGDKEIKYQSIFKMNGNSYSWVSTERIN